MSFLDFKLKALVGQKPGTTIEFLEPGTELITIENLGPSPLYVQLARGLPPDYFGQQQTRVEAGDIYGGPRLCDAIRLEVKSTPSTTDEATGTIETFTAGQIPAVRIANTDDDEGG